VFEDSGVTLETLIRILRIQTSLYRHLKSHFKVSDITHLHEAENEELLECEAQQPFRHAVAGGLLRTCHVVDGTAWVRQRDLDK
jgi:hypothetical protein